MNIRVKYGRVIPSPGSHMCGLTWDGHFLWHSDGSTNQLYCFDLSTNQLLRSLPCPEVRTGLSFTIDVYTRSSGQCGCDSTPDGAP